MNRVTINRSNLAGWIIAIGVFLVALNQPAISQARYSGSWHKVSVINTNSISDATILDFGFRDSLLGLLCGSLDTGRIYYTVDGGHSWSEDSSTGSTLFPKLELNCVEATGSNHGVTFKLGTTLVISPFGSIEIPNEGIDSLGLYLPYLPIAQKMTDSARGYRLVIAMDYHNYPSDSVLLMVTNDAWQHSTIYGKSYHYSPIQNGFNSSQNFYGGVMLDSSEIWTANRNTVLHTSDAGAHWESFVPVDSNKYKPNWYNFIAKPSSHEIYVEAPLSNVDFAYSSDYGKSWRLDSTFGVGLWRMAVPAPGIIWAMLGHGPSAGVFIDPTNAAYPNIRGLTSLSNKIAYSTDNGLSWYIDSTTFAGDTLEEMHFTDARHGWIAGYANNEGHIWYYDADASGVAEAKTNATEVFTLYPNPASNTIKVLSSSGALSIVDPLGRSYIAKQNDNSVDISSLFPGVYFVSDGRTRAKFIKE